MFGFDLYQDSYFPWLTDVFVLPQISPEILPGSSIDQSSDGGTIGIATKSIASGEFLFTSSPAPDTFQ